MAFFKGGKGSGRNQGDTKSSIPINQIAHGFTVPQAVYLDDGDGLYKLAKADVLATANAIGIVSSVQDVNNFTLTTAGAKNIFTGLTEGDTYYVSASTAGDLTNTAPTIIRPIMNSISATRGIIFTDAVLDLSGVDTVYIADGDIVDSVRTVGARLGKQLLLEGTDTTSFITANKAAQLIIDETQVVINHLDLNGAGTVLSKFEISLSDATGMRVLDSKHSTGLVYAANYTTNFNIRSLVDKGYVDGAISADPTIFSSDGDIAGDRIVAGPSGRMISFNCFDGTNFGNSNEQSFVQVVSNDVSVGYLELDGAGNIVDLSQLVITPLAMTVSDSVNNKGLLYAVDYSTNFTDRSLIDKAYVDNNTLYSSNGVISENRTVEVSNSSAFNLTAFDQSTHATSNEESRLALDSNEVILELLQLDGAGNTDSVAGLTITSIGGMLVTDTTDLAGLKYAADYSGNFTARSLVDKAYSDNNSIYQSDGSVTGNRTVSASLAKSLDFRSYNAATFGTSTALAELFVQDGAVTLGHAVLSLGIKGNRVEIEITPSTGMEFTDSILNKGAFYNADYSANYTPRSLVDKGYVDTSTVQSITGGTNINVAGTATVPIVNLDAAITGTSVNGVTLTTAGNATDFLNATGAYSAPATIFNSSGNVSATRVINAPLGRMLSFNTFDVNDFSDSSEEGFLQVVSSKVGVGYLDLDGAGGINGLSQITIDATGMIVTDSINNKGFEYSIDYSASFTDRSLIDKAYSDLGHLSRVESGAANLTSSGKPILAVTDSSAPRTVTIATSDVVEGNQFIVKDEFGDSGMNPITVTTPTISVTSVASGSSGSDFLTSTAHGYSVNQRIIHATFADGDYNGIFTVTAIVSTTRYEVAAITFVATGTGTSNVAIDGQSSFTIGVNYGSLEFYCNDNQVFTKGGGNTALAVRSATTGLLEGGEMSIVGGLPSNTLDIGAATGQIVDQSSPGSPVLTSVSVEADASYTIANPTDGVFLIAIDVDSNVVELDLTTLTKEERHQHVIIGAYVATSGGGGGAVRILDEPVNVGYGISTALADFLADAIGPINMQGNTITGSVTDLSINTSAGTSYIVGQNYRVDPDCPNERSLPQATGFGFRRSFVDTGDVLGLESAGATFTEINPLMYNPTAGTVTAVANNNYTAQQVYLAPTGIYNVAYGQIQSTSESTIIDAVEDGTAFTEIAAFMDQVLIGIIVVQMTAGNLSTATFLQPEKFRMNVPA